MSSNREHLRNSERNRDQKGFCDIFSRFFDYLEVKDVEDDPIPNVIFGEVDDDGGVYVVKHGQKQVVPKEKS